MLEITSKDNQYLKLARSLRHKKDRQEQGLLLAEGLRLAEEAVAAARCRCVIFTETALAERRVQALAQCCRERDLTCLRVSQALFDGLAVTDHPQGVLAVCAQPQPWQPAPAPWLAYGDDIADPGNLGALMRSAYAAGATALLLSPQAADPWNPKTVRASMGAVFRLPLWRAAAEEEAARLLLDLGLTPLITTMAGRDIRLCGELLRQPHCWILGCEARGVSDFWLQQPTARAVSLPMAPGAESLNVAAAGAVLFYQSFFQQQVLP